MESSESRESPTPVDVSILKVGDIFTIVDNPIDPEDTQYKYAGCLPGPDGMAYGFKTIPKYEYAGSQMLKITGSFQVIQIQKIA